MCCAYSSCLHQDKTRRDKTSRYKTMQHRHTCVHTYIYIYIYTHGLGLRDLGCCFRGFGGVARSREVPCSPAPSCPLQGSSRRGGGVELRVESGTVIAAVGSVQSDSRSAGAVLWVVDGRSCMIPGPKQAAQTLGQLETAGHLDTVS